MITPSPDTIEMLSCFFFSGKKYKDMHNFMISDWTAEERRKRSLLRIGKNISGPRQAKKLPSSIRRIYGFTSPCTCSKSPYGICSPLVHSIVSNDSVYGQCGCVG